MLSKSRALLSVVASNQAARAPKMASDINSSLPYATGDTLSSSMVAYRLIFPVDDWVLWQIQAALNTLTAEENWLQEGAILIDNVVSAMCKSVEDFSPLPILVGMCFPFAGAVPPSGTLFCDGASVLRADYPELFAVIGTQWGAVDLSHFNVPDMRSRVPVGAGQGVGLSYYPLASQTGEENHTLTNAEAPSHSHTDIGHTHVEGNAAASIVTIGAGAPTPSAVPSVGVTGSGSASLTSSGSGGAHNNIQPSVALNYVIVAR